MAATLAIPDIDVATAPGPGRDLGGLRWRAGCNPDTAMLRPITLGLAAVLAGCLTPPDNDVIQWSDDFEACDDLCDWSRAGDVTRVSTYHPGEHAMRLGPGASAGHPLAIARDDSGWGDPVMSYDDGNWLEVSTDCVGPGALELRAAGTDRFAIELVLDERGVGPFVRHRVNFPPLDPLIPVTFVALDVRAGALPCVIDNLQIRISGGDSGY